MYTRRRQINAIELFSDGIGIHIFVRKGTVLVVHV